MKELKKPIRNVKNMDRVMWGAYTICFVFYWATGAFGYFQFGTVTKSDILAGLPSTAYNTTVRVCVQCGWRCASSSSSFFFSFSLSPSLSFSFSLCPYFSPCACVFVL